MNTTSASGFSSTDLTDFRPIYLDHAATTPVDPAVFEVMRPYFMEKFGNPNSVHSPGRDARAGIDWARGTIARILNCHPREIVFTSGATEANNLAIRGVAEWQRNQGSRRLNHIVTTAIEHEAVLQVVRYLDNRGFEHTIVPVDSTGIVEPERICDAIREETCLISVMYANNEIGTIQPIAEIAQIAREHGVVLHTDAVQAANALSLDVDNLGVDLLSLSAHKLYAPKGVGLLYVRSGVNLEWLLLGGGQEYARRAGTENVAGIVGFAAGLVVAAEEQSERTAHAIALRDRLIEGILENIPNSRLNGDRIRRVPNNVNVSFVDVDGESLLLDLDLNGIAASSGSACASASGDPSHVLLALGLSPELAEGSLRLTIGKDNTEAEIDRAITIIAESVARIRHFSLQSG